MNELERKEIIKELEGLVKFITCPEYVQKALSLIKELTEEKKKSDRVFSDLCKEAETYLAQRECLRNQVKNLTEECANLHTSCTELERKCASLNDENERLEKLSEDFGRDVDVKLKYILELEDKYDKELDKLKAEKADVTYFKEQLIADTVRKMQERLTLEFNRFHKSNFMTPELRQWIIDQIAKELMEGKDEHKED